MIETVDLFGNYGGTLHETLRQAAATEPIAWDSSTGAAMYVRPRPPRYVRIPSSFWQNGWIVTLSPPAIAMMLILKSIQGKKPDPIFIVPAVADARYALSQETRTKGFRELEANGLLHIGSDKRGDEAYWNRVRNTYALDLDRLEEAPGSSTNRA